MNRTAQISTKNRTGDFQSPIGNGGDGNTTARAAEGAHKSPVRIESKRARSGMERWRRDVTGLSSEGPPTVTDRRYSGTVSRRNPLWSLVAGTVAAVYDRRIVPQLAVSDGQRPPRQFQRALVPHGHPTPHAHCPPTPLRAFSLVELLVVIVVLVLLMVLASNAFNVGNSSRKLTTGAQVLSGHFDRARQLAITRNQYTQVRFYSPTGETGVTRVGIFLAESPFYGSATEYDDWTAAGKFQQETRDLVLGEGLVIPGEAKASKLIDLLRNDSTITRTGTATTGGESYDFVAFYYRPDGTPDFQWLDGGELPPDEAYISLVQEARYEKSQPDLPKNFATLVFVPATGRTVTLRP